MLNIRHLKKKKSKYKIRWLDPNELKYRQASSYLSTHGFNITYSKPQRKFVAKQEIKLGPSVASQWLLYNLYSVYEVTFIQRNLQTPHLINKSAISELHSLAPPHTNPHMASCGSQEVTYRLLVAYFMPLV